MNSHIPPDRSRTLLLFGGLLAGLAIVYSFAFHISYLEDDYQWVFVHPSRVIFGGFLHTIASDNQWYRPMQAMLLGIIQTLWGMDTLPIRIAEILLHAALSVQVYRMLRELAVAEKAALTAAVFFAFTQIAALIVISNDMLAQTLSCAFCALCLWSVWRSRAKAQGVPAIAYVWFVIALLSKETSAGLIVGVAVLLLFFAEGETAARKLRDATLRGLPFAVLWALYMVVRNLIGATKPHFDSGMYGLHFGLNVIRNLSLFVAQSLMPVSSLEAMRAMYYHNSLGLALMGVLALLMVSLTIWGLLRSEKKRDIALLVMLFLTSLTPAIFLNHISESYIYNALPWIAMLVGISAEHYWRLLPTTTVVTRVALSIATLTLFVANVEGSIGKALAMKADADRADILLPQIAAVVTTLPSSGRLYLVNPTTNQFEYSVYTEKGFRVVNCTELYIQRLTGRPDASMFILDSAAYKDSIAVHPGVGYSYDRSLRIFRLQPQ